MRNKRFLVAIAGALCFGLIAVVSVSRYLTAAQTLGGNASKVVLTKVDLPVGTKLSAEQLTVAQLPSGSTPNGTFESADKLIGRVTLSSIAAREVVTESKLAPGGTSAGLSAVIPDGYRAMTVRVDEVVGVSGFITPGTLVDVVVVTQPPENSKTKDTISKIVLQNIKVLASGQNIDRSKDDREASAVKSVTLLVTPEQAEKLALAATEGKVTLVMRNSVDQQNETTTGANKRSMLTGEAATQVGDPSTANEQPKRAPVPRAPVRMRQVNNPPPKAAATHPSVELFQGAKRSTVEFP